MVAGDATLLLDLSRLACDACEGDTGAAVTGMMSLAYLAWVFIPQLQVQIAGLANGMWYWELGELASYW